MEKSFKEGKGWKEPIKERNKYGTGKSRMNNKMGGAAE